MDEENQSNHLTKNQIKSDAEFKTSKPPSNRSTKCFVYVLLTVVLLSIAFLIFGLVVLRIKSPTFRLSNVVVQDLRYQSSSLNMTVVAQIRLHNMNFGRFKFHGGSTTLLYGSAIIGATDFYDGRIGSRGKTNIVAVVKVIAGGGNELSGSNMNFSRDVGLGLVKLRSLAELRGEVRVVKIVNRHRTAVMNCAMDLNLTSQAVQDFSCQ